VLDRLRPAAFVMENVKGMLSSTVESRLVFEMLMEDLASLGTGRGHHYEMRAIRVADGRPACRRPRSLRISSSAPRNGGFRSGVTA
jgi:DNA (cytosine-5)-methyltransferase 1